MFSGNALLAILHFEIAKTFFLPAALSNLARPCSPDILRSQADCHDMDGGIES